MKNNVPSTALLMSAGLCITAVTQLELSLLVLHTTGKLYEEGTEVQIQ